VLALIGRAREQGIRVTIPATALAQAMRNPKSQARLSRSIRQSGTDVVVLDGVAATAIGMLLTRTGMADVVDAHVISCAQRSGQSIVTSDPKHLKWIAPAVDLAIV
jgi:hypothetical protein